MLLLNELLKIELVGDLALREHVDLLLQKMTADDDDDLLTYLVRQWCQGSESTKITSVSILLSQYSHCLVTHPSASDSLATLALYKFTYLLTYLLTKCPVSFPAFYGYLFTE